MASSTLDENAIRTGEIEMAARSGQSAALDLASQVAREGKLYYCVVDRLAYRSLDMALVHVRMQHGAAARASVLLRAGAVGRGL